MIFVISFAQTNEAKIRGYKKAALVSMSRVGVVKHSSGDGIIKIEMHFLPDVFVPCEVCHGRRYNSETSKSTTRKNIAVLDMTVNKAVEFFKHIPKLNANSRPSKMWAWAMAGATADHLSGGEANEVGF